MLTIYKYPLVVEDEQSIQLPDDAKILTIQIQNGQPFLWVLLDNQLPSNPRKILIRGTGHDSHGVGKYISTFQMHGGSLVFHAFEG